MPLYYQKDVLKDPKPAALDEQKARDFFNYIMRECFILQVMDNELLGFTKGVELTKKLRGILKHLKDNVADGNSDWGLRVQNKCTKYAIRLKSVDNSEEMAVALSCKTNLIPSLPPSRQAEALDYIAMVLFGPDNLQKSQL